MSLRVLNLCVCVRLLSALATGQSAFNPDEYWQSMELAYSAVWSGGFVPWEFQSHAALRGTLHPLLFAALYWALKITHMDSAWMVAHAPRIMQALFAAVGDYALYLLARRLSGDRGAKWTLFCSLSSWFLFYASTRTLSNSLEMSLTIVALYLWPDTCAFTMPVAANAREWPMWLSRRRSALVLAAITFVIRPTSALLWLVLGVVHLCSLPSWSHRAALLFRDVLPIGAMTLCLSVGLDSLFYNRHLLFSRSDSGDGFAILDWSTLWSSLRFPLVSLNFLRINSGTDLAALYGTHPWHWYLSEGLPTNLGPLTPLFVIAVVQFARGKLNRSDRESKREAGVVLPSESRRALWILLSALCFSVAVYSCNAHKEPRFLMPVTPVAFLLVGAWMARREELEEETSSDAAVPPSATSVASDEAPVAGGMRRRKPEAASSSVPLVPLVSSAPAAAAVGPRRSSRRLFRPLLAFLLVSNAAMAFYFTFVHQSGPARVFASLSKLESEWRSRRCSGDLRSASCRRSSEQFSVHFLMSCHSMPLYSWLHRAPLADGRRSVQLHFLDCSPLFIAGKLQGNGSNACSASRLFNEDAAAFVNQYYAAPEPSLAHIRRSAARDRFHRSDCEWSWYHSPAYLRCLSSRMGLDETQALAIDNELPGGGFTPMVEPSSAAGSSALRCSLPPEPLLPHVLVLPLEKLEDLRPWLQSRDYALKASLFHSHFDDTKRYLVFQRNDDEEEAEQ